ncbi:MAG TPA: hypothetical protein VGL34_25145 [Steroidobacteraceae bacterium]|jgi:hypothetical protein
MLLGRSIDEVLELSERELRSWKAYWRLEPWGPYRDNMHAAMTVQQLLRPHLKEGAQPPSMMEFMFIEQSERDEAIRVANRERYLGAFRARAKERVDGRR